MSARLVHSPVLERCSAIPGFGDVDVEARVRSGSITEHKARIGEQYYQFVFRGMPSRGVAYVYGSDVTARRRSEE